MAPLETYTLPDGIEITGEMKPEYYSILSPQATLFIALATPRIQPTQEGIA